MLCESDFRSRSTRSESSACTYAVNANGCFAPRNNIVENKCLCATGRYNITRFSTFIEAIARVGVSNLISRRAENFLDEQRDYEIEE